MQEGFAVKLDRIVGRTGWDKTRFGISVVMDMIGNGSYLGWLLGGVEELMPGTDIVPTCTLYHIYCMRAKYGDASEAPRLPAATPTR